MPLALLTLPSSLRTDTPLLVLLGVVLPLSAPEPLDAGEMGVLGSVPPPRLLPCRGGRCSSTLRALRHGKQRQAGDAGLVGRCRACCVPSPGSRCPVPGTSGCLGPHSAQASCCRQHGPPRRKVQRALGLADAAGRRAAVDHQHCLGTRAQRVLQQPRQLAVPAGVEKSEGVGGWGLRGLRCGRQASGGWWARDAAQVGGVACPGRPAVARGAAGGRGVQAVTQCRVARGACL